MKRIFSIILILTIVLSFPIVFASQEDDGFIKIEAQYGRVMALKSDGTVWAWGDNINGFLCDGSAVDRYVMVKLDGVENIVDIAMSYWYTALLADDGTVWLCGNNGDFQTDMGKPLRTPQKSDLSTWYIVKGNSDKESEKYKAYDSGYDIKSGVHEELVIKHDGTLWFSTYERYWSYDIGQYLIRNEESYELKEFSGAKDVAIDSDSYYIVCADGSIVSKGSNYSGQLGNGFSSTLASPILLNGINNIKKVCYSDDLERQYVREKNIYYFLHTDGLISFYNCNGTEHSFEKIPIENVCDLVVNRNVALALKDDGSVWTWSTYDLLDNGKAIPVKIAELKNIKAIFSIDTGISELAYGAIDINGDIYMQKIVNDELDFVAELLKQERVTYGSFGKITGIGENNNSYEYLNFSIILDRVNKIVKIKSVQGREVDCTFPLELIDKNSYFMKLFHNALSSFDSVINGGSDLIAFDFTITKENGGFIGHVRPLPLSQVQTEYDISGLKGINDLTDIGSGFVIDDKGIVYYWDDITQSNYTLFSSLPYGYQADWKKIASAVITLKIGSNIMFNNNIEVTIPASPIIVHDRTLIPIREVIEALGGQVEWNGESSTVTVTLSENKLVLTAGNLDCIINGKTVTTDVAPQIINDKTYLPLRFICENIGATVYFEEIADRITIVK